MEENKIQNDRFYEDKKEMKEMFEYAEPIQDKKEMLEYAPEPLHMRESLRKGSFTVGNKYPIVEKNTEKDSSFISHPFQGSDFDGRSYKFKTVDDKGLEVWTDDKYFIPAERVLTFDETESDVDCVTDEWAGANPDIRKMAEEQGVERWDVKDGCIQIKESKYPIKEVNTLAGLCESEDEIEDSSDDSEEPVCKTKMKRTSFRGSENNSWKSEPFWKTTCNGKRPMRDNRYEITEGVVKDEGNDMMYDADKCLAAMSKVFGNKEVVDPDDIINSIREIVWDHVLTWEEGYLTVDGAKTKVAYEDVQKAYSGLKTLVSASVAEKNVSKLVARKLRKLF